MTIVRIFLCNKITKQIFYDIIMTKDSIGEMKQILAGFAEKIDIISMNNIPMAHTI